MANRPRRAKKLKCAESLKFTGLCPVSLCGYPSIEFQRPAQSLMTGHWPLPIIGRPRFGKRNHIGQSLMVSLLVIMRDIMRHNVTKGPLAEDNESRQRF